MTLCDRLTCPKLQARSGVIVFLGRDRQALGVPFFSRAAASLQDAMAALPRRWVSGSLRLVAYASESAPTMEARWRSVHTAHRPRETHFSTTNGSNFHERGAASPENLLVDFIRVHSGYSWFKDIRAGWGARRSGNETPWWLGGSVLGQANRSHGRGGGSTSQMARRAQRARARARQRLTLQWGWARGRARLVAASL